MERQGGQKFFAVGTLFVVVCPLQLWVIVENRLRRWTISGQNRHASSKWWVIVVPLIRRNMVCDWNWNGKSSSHHQFVVMLIRRVASFSFACKVVVSSFWCQAMGDGFKGHSASWEKIRVGFGPVKPLGLVPGDCEAYGGMSTCVRSKFLSRVGSWAGLMEGRKGEGVWNEIVGAKGSL